MIGENMNTVKNKWLKTRKKAELTKRLDALMMEAWASEVSLGDFIASLPQELRDFFLEMNFNTPVVDDNGIDLSLHHKQ